MKVLRIDMPDGSQWDVPAELIARNRARYYASKDTGKPTDSAEYQKALSEEYDYTMGDHYELKDWAANNMNWKDVRDHARKVADPRPCDFQEGWMNGEKHLVEANY